MKVSIVIPVYNEVKSIARVIEAVRSASFGFPAEREIIVVDDGSTDGTHDVLARTENIQKIFLPSNVGKGAALKKGFAAVTGDIVIIQDADFEYNPEDYPVMLKPIVDGHADVVYGSRFRGSVRRVIHFKNSLGNVLLTFLSNVFTNLNLSDMETGYKVFRREVITAITPRLRSKRFGIEPELTARIAHGSWRIFEVPINYYGRTYKEGKKIGWRDGIKAVGAIVYFNIFDR